MIISIEEKVYHNLALAQFLKSLENNHDREIAGKTIDWIKQTYPQIAEILNGELILEDIKEQ